MLLSEVPCRARSNQGDSLVEGIEKTRGSETASQWSARGMKRSSSDRVANVNDSGQTPEQTAFRDIQPVRVFCDPPIPPGPVVVAIDVHGVPQRVIAVEVLTTLGGLAAFTQIKLLCPDATAIVAGIALPNTDDGATSVAVQPCEPHSQAETVWWEQLLGWAAHRQTA